MTQVLVEIIKEEALTSSLQIADVFEKRHADVLESINNLVTEKSVAKFFQSGTYENRGKSYPLYHMNRDGFSLLAMGFTGEKALKFKLKYIEAFNQMENYIKNNQIKIPQNPMEALELFFVSQKEIDGRVGVIEENLNEIKENQLISTEDKNAIDRMVGKRVHGICKMQHLGQEAKSLLFSDLGKSIKELFEVPHRGRIKDKDFQRAVDFIATWEPSSVTKNRISQLSLDV